MSERSILIVGAGHAGVAAAHGLREHGWHEKIVLISDEGYLPYDRPALSKGVIAGLKTIEQAEILSKGWIEKNKINFVKGLSVSQINIEAQTATLSDGAKLDFHRLIFATGAYPRKLGVLGEQLCGVVYLRKAQDALVLKDRLVAGQEIVIIGGGLIGLEVAATAVTLGCKITVVEKSSRLLARVAPAELATAIQTIHEARGVKFIFEGEVEHFEGETTVSGVKLLKHARLSCDLVLVAVGAAPAIELAEQVGLRVDNGIIVDQFLHSSNESIYAVGDVARYLTNEGKLVRLESWKNANDQGECVAQNILGKKLPYQPMPWIWSDQFDVVMQVVGWLSDEWTCVRRDFEKNEFVLFMLDADMHMRAAAAIGPVSMVGRAIKTCQAIIQKKIIVSADDLVNLHIDLKSLTHGNRVASPLPDVRAQTIATVAQ